MQKILNKTNYNILFPNQIQLIYLTDWSFVTIEGTDSKNYLQGLITYNINLLKDNQHTLCAQCKINGKVLSILRLFKYNSNYAYIQRHSTNDLQLSEIKKYSIFSNVKINYKHKKCLLGIIGKQSSRELLKFFSKIPNKDNPVHHENQITLLWFNKPYERFLIIIDKCSSILKELQNSIKQVANNSIWLALEIASKFPIINLETSGKYLPQSLNLKKLKGLDFNKGCYHGQEIISKTYFKKLNKYNLHWLYGQTSLNPKIGNYIEINTEKNQYYNCGIIISIIKFDKINIWIQAVLKKNINYSGKILKIKNDTKSILYSNNSNYI